MNICVLESSYEGSQSPHGEFDCVHDARLYLEGHKYEIHSLKKSTARAQIDRLTKANFDVFINLCDGSDGEDRPGIEVVRMLEESGVPFTGADLTFYEPSREEMKRVCLRLGINTPGFVLARSQEDITRAQSLTFPLLVKHPSSYGSIGLSKQSRVETFQQLREQAEIMMGCFGAALIEEFIDGREFTVLVVENPYEQSQPTVYQPVEFLFPEHETFKHFDLKWIEYKQMSCVPCRDAEINERLIDISRKFFVGLRGVSYGRCDIRMNKEGELFMLEINPNCGIFGRAEESNCADHILNYENAQQDFIERIIEAAMHRADMRKLSRQTSAARR